MSNPLGESAPGRESGRHRKIKEWLEVIGENRWDGSQTERGLVWDLNRRPDVFWWAPGKRVAAEVQVSPMSMGEFERKLQDYTEHDIHAFYVVDESRLRTPDNVGSWTQGERSFHGFESTPETWVRVLHGLQYGRVYVWLEKLASILGLPPGIYPVHLDPAWRWREKRNGELYQHHLKARRICEIGPAVLEVRPDGHIDHRLSPDCLHLDCVTPMTAKIRSEFLCLARAPDPVFWKGDTEWRFPREEAA